MMTAREAGINADWQHIGDTGGFLDFAQLCGSAVLIDDLKREGLKELRRRNSRMILVQRDYYAGAEGRWRDIEYDGKPHTPERMFDVLTAGYNNSIDVYIYFGNEPARGNKDINELLLDIEFYCKVIQLFINAKIKVCVMNIQVVELTPEKLSLYNPIFDLCNRYPQYVVFGMHEYFTLILMLGIGSGDWSRLLKWGDYPRDSTKWAKAVDLVANAVNAQIARDVWIAAQAWKKYPNVRFFKTEQGFDRINNLPQLGALDNANGGRLIRGLDTIIALLHRYFNDDGQTIAGDQIVWMFKTDTVCETGMFYNWSTQPEWLDYSCAPYGGFRQVLLDYNHRVRIGSVETQPVVTTPIEQPPTTPTKRTNIQIAADMQKLVDELKAG